MDIELMICSAVASIFGSAFVLLTASHFKYSRRFREAEKILAKVARLYIDMAFVKVNVKRLDQKATMLRFKKVGDSGADLASIEDVTLEPGETRKIRTGIAVELPPMIELQIRPRSSMSANGVIAQFGTVDCGYRGEIMCVLTNTTKDPYEVKVGDRIAQAVLKPVPVVDFIETDKIDTNTDRGTGGFGSTGVN